VSGDYNFVSGGRHKVNGNGCIVSGTYNNVKGDDSSNFGDFGIITANQSLVEGGYC